MNPEINSSSKHRSRLITPTTNGSFYSLSTLSPHTIKHQSYEYFELTDNELLFESPLESELNNSTIECYFKLNKRKDEVNKVCIHLLTRENSIHKRKSEVSYKINHINDCDALKAIKLLENEGNIAKLESDLKIFEEYIYDLEDKLQNSNTEKINIKSEYVKVKKSINEMTFIKENILKHNKILKTLELRKKELEFEKEIFLNNYRHECKRITSSGDLFMGLHETKAYINEIRGNNQEKCNEISEAKIRKQKLEDELMEIEMRNAEASDEIIMLNKKNSLIMHQNLLRRQ